MSKENHLGADRAPAHLSLSDVEWHRRFGDEPAPPELTHSFYPATGRGDECAAGRADCDLEQSTDVLDPPFVQKVVFWFVLSWLAGAAAIVSLNAWLGVAA